MKRDKMVLSCGTAMIDQFYSGVQALGGGRWDTSSLLKLLQDPK